MISLATPQQAPRLLEICRRTPCVGPRVWVDFHIAADNPKMPYRFYLSPPGTLIELTGRGAVVCGNPASDEEVALFLKMSGAARLISDGWAPGGWHTSRYEMLARPAGPFAEASPPAALDEAPRTEEVLAVLESSDGRIRPEDSRDGFAADLCARRNRGYAAVYGIREAGRLAATAGVYALSDTEAYLACVETVAPARGRGHAAALVGLLCQRFGGGRQMTLLCDESLSGFYTPFGFAPLGRQAVMASRPGPE